MKRGGALRKRCLYPPVVTFLNGNTVTSMKKIAIGLVLAIVAGTVYAQGQRKDHGDIRMHLRMMDSLLDLSDEQEAKMEAVHLKYRDSMVMVRTTRDCDKAQRLQQAKHKEVVAILSAEQKKVLESHRKERREAHAAMQKELKELHETRFKPEVIKQRKAFDKQLSPDEKYSIEMARAEIEVCRNMHESDTTSVADRMHMGGPGFLNWMPEDVKLQLKASIDNHDSTLRPIIDALKAEHMKLQPEIEAIKEKYGHKAGFKHGGNGMRKGQGNKMGPDHGDWLVYYFLLMEVK